MSDTASILDKYGVTMTIEPNGVYNKWDAWRRRYEVMLRGNNFEYTTPFYDSGYNYEHNITPTELSVLGCLEYFEPEKDMWDFAKEFGYEINSRETYREVSEIHFACRRQYEAMRRLFGDRLEELYEEVNG